VELDHIVYAAPDLQAAVADFTERTGLRPVEGGAHPGWGTRNHLVGLGPDIYLEIVGPDPEQEEPAEPRPFMVDALRSPGIVTWCVRTDDLDAAVVRAHALNLDLGVVRGMSRRTPEGTLLQWRLTDPRDAPFAGLVPFLIDWGATPHPAESLTVRAGLADMHLSAPEPAALAARLAALGLDTRPEPGPTGITVTLDTPKGEVILPPGERR
jgi:catechol 2,3-dioxygenase-like lactoylglutathione lyase family enzyme